MKKQILIAAIITLLSAGTALAGNTDTVQVKIEFTIPEFVRVDEVTEKIDSQAVGIGHRVFDYMNRQESKDGDYSTGVLEVSSNCDWSVLVNVYENDRQENNSTFSLNFKNGEGSFNAINEMVREMSEVRHYPGDESMRPDAEQHNNELSMTYTFIIE